ncbi:hypothetical protein AVEN_259538-1 [Araneus ventricosus]|uniref:Tc1-like transposase DDE domain-containing protein n=1 Tax=Araneus ventricosus TaxID=182803 RepID=A0A4Y2NWT0_ARAVE|nr:hypothetical protein AVEN_259538-1 [Araneus ventricosus]
MSIGHSDVLGQFQQNNATPHVSRVASKWLQEHSSDFRHFHWPPKSPEMKIIEDIRDALLHAVEKRSRQPSTPIDLLTALQDSLCEFPPGYLQTPVESMPRRFASFLRALGARRDIKNVYQFFWLFSVNIFVVTVGLNIQEHPIFYIVDQGLDQKYPFWFLREARGKCQRNGAAIRCPGSCATWEKVLVVLTTFFTSLTSLVLHTSNLS